MNLADEAPLVLGVMDVDPATREVAWPGGRAELQPRAMQVLIVLVRAAGAVVSRDQLVAACWDGRAVSGDAVHRIVHLLREVARRSGGLGYSIQTIPRVGYRLSVREPIPETRKAPPGAQVVALASRRRGGGPVLALDRGRGGARLALEPLASAEPDARSLVDGEGRPAPAPLLAVLAFDNLTGEADLGYFSDGVAEEIAHTVLKTTGLKVVGRSSSFALRGAERSAQHVAGVLGATHLLDGSVRREGERLRITAQLVACASQTTLWSGRFDRPLTDVFVLQDEIAAAVAAALKVAFAPSRNLAPIDPAAFDIYLRAREFGVPTYIPRCDLLEQAVARAPDFAQAWGLLAYARGVILRLGWAAGPFDEARGQVLEAARTALALDPTCAVAYVALATVEPICGAFEAHQSRVEKAVAASPNEPLVLIHACGVFDVVGLQRRALSYAARADELDPRSVGFYLAYMLEATGRPREAQQRFDRDLTRWPDVLLLNTTALRSAYEAADWQRYDALLTRLPPQVSINPIVQAISGLAARLRDWSPSTAQATLAEMRSALRETGTVGLTWVGLLGSRGLADEAYDIVAQASFAHLFTPEGRLPPFEMGLNILFSPLYRVMRQDIRFVRLCHDLGLTRFWAQSGQWPDCTLEVAPHYDLKAEALRLLSP